MKKEIIKKNNQKNRIVTGATNFFNKKGERVYFEIKEFCKETEKFFLLGRNVTINDVKY